MEENDNDLVERSRAGDTDAFGLLVERHSARIFRTAYRLTGHRESAEDVVQEALLRAYRKLDRFDSRAQFGTWLHRIVVNCAMDLHRKAKRRETKAPMLGEESLEAVASSEPHPERQAQSREIRRAVARVLETMSPKERAAFVLRHFEGRSIAEIGSLLGMRTNACKSAVFRAVRRLRADLHPLLTEKP